MEQRARLSGKRRFVFAALAIVIVLGLLEAGARVHDALQPERLEAYKQLSANPTLGYELIPNYRARTPNNRRDALVINALGYRGPEFSPAKSPGTTRIICVGDSCTFEGIPEEAPYPRQLEQLLNKEGQRYEVINAGVEGYDSTKALERLRGALQYQPDVVTIYIGWNDLYNNDPNALAASNSKFMRRLALMLQYSRFAAKLRTLIFLKLRPQLKTREAVNADRYRNYRPTQFEQNLLEMITLIQKHNARPYVMTLPSILSAQISDGALARAQFPRYTNSVADMEVLIERYNTVIREIASKTGTPVIDLAERFNSMPEKERFFSDTIHMYNDAKPIVAQAIEQELKSGAQQ